MCLSSADLLKEMSLKIFFSLLSLQNAINPLNQSQRTVDSTGNGGALNTPGILVFLIYFVLCDQQKRFCDLHYVLSYGAAFITQSRRSLASYTISRS